MGRESLFSNIFNLLLLQGMNYIMPLVTFPYLVRVLGVDQYGVLAFCLAVSSYFILITDYGFNLSATRQVSINRDDPQKISEIFGSVLFIKLLLMAACFLVMVCLVFWIERFSQIQGLLFISFGMVFGQILFPIWLFQGMERMKYITYLSILAKLIFTVGIFLFVNNEADIWLVPLLNSIGLIFIGVVSIFIVVRQFGVRFYIPNRQVLVFYLKDGWDLFTSNLAILGYKNNSILLLAFYLDPINLGFYSIGKKIFEAINGLNVVLSQAFFPSVSQAQKDTGLAISNRLRSLFSISIILSFSIFLFTFFFAGYISLIVSGSQEAVVIEILRMLAIALFIIGINVPAVQYLLTTGNSRRFSVIVWCGVLIDLALLFLLVPKFDYRGALYATLISETLITLSLYYYSYSIFNKRKYV
ncbi:flippase [Algoriphagus oliviformis]|nr:flippase [Algoriphagus oliviformis]